MGRRIACISLIVDDYDRAIDWYTRILSFRLIEDTAISESKRWVLISPDTDDSTLLLLAKAADEVQKKAIGNQTGGRVFLFLKTSRFDHDYNNLLFHGVTIERPPRMESYGRVAVFEDLYGNRWDLLEDS
jgi:catechol 2,3-dioxygenase-like lactoylglutathione lyase family enzyme